VNLESPHRWFDVGFILNLVNNIFLLYFAAVLLIDTEKKLKYMTLVIAVSTVYLIYWINDQYFFQGKFGRIGGPGGLNGGNVYVDENAFAMLFVTGLPFLYYLGLYYKNKIIRYGLWAVVPFGWHAVFLTGSRGGLVGLAVTTIVIAMRSSRKIIGFGVILLFAVAYQLEAGDTMKSRADTISDYEQEDSAESRIKAWKAAIGMIESHPLTGVGLSSFGVAFPDFSNETPREAHDTFLQISAESGVIAGIMYVLVVSVSIVVLWRRGKTLEQDDENDGPSFLYIANEAILASFIGLVICSLFLSLHVYEIFYFLCALVGALSLISKRNEGQPAYNNGV
jgi:probable O-glycosylation ligase (exosortase A-associated)